MRLLCAVDNATLRKMIDLMLAPSGIDIDFVDNGLEALKAARRNAYDAMLVDMELSRLSGVAFAQKLRLMERKRHFDATPILYLSGQIETHEAEDAMRIGLCGRIAKPFTTQRLIEALDAVMIKARPFTIGAMLKALH